MTLGEHIIDIMQEWVMGWITPMNVTGALWPDCRCRYFRAGTHNGRPYYIRNDGSYFLWWDSTGFWAITTALGVPAFPYWRRIDPSIIGAYTPGAPATGIATVTSGYGCTKVSYVDRGDPANWDFDQLGLNFDGTWRDLDLSLIVPLGVQAIDINLVSLNTTVGRAFLMRRAGNVNGRAVSGVDTVVANAWHYTNITVGCDANQHVEYMGHLGGWTSLMGTIKGWWY